MNGHSNIDPLQATEHLKNILNVGKPDSNSSKKGISNGSLDSSADSKSLQQESYQRIDLCFNKDSSHVPLYGTDIDVYSSSLDRDSTCNQVFMENVIAYGWEEKYYYGRLISIHLSGQYIAVVIKPPGKNHSFVRILRNNSESRCLIKDYKHEVKDVSFAHSLEKVLLGSVDACGELLVHKIGESGSVVTCNLLLRVLRPSDWLPSDHNHIIWCFYIPDDANEEDSPAEDISSLLVMTHNERTEVWNVDHVVKQYGQGNLTIEEVKSGAQVIEEQVMPITTATFSPDGTALAIGNMEGAVKFFHVNVFEKEDTPNKCLHQWEPHPGKSLTTLYFLDNYKNHKPDASLWKFAVTGADNNTEIKFWSCESWTCLQTIRIHPHPSDSVTPCLKSEIDLSAQCFFLSDIKRKTLYIFNLQQDPMPNNIITNCLSEYNLPFSVLSYATKDISIVKLHSLAGCKNSEEGEKDQIGDSLGEDDNCHQYKIDLFWIYNKYLQSCHILYKPAVSSPLIPTGSIGSLSHESFVTAFKDGLSDISMDSRDASRSASKDLELSSKSLHDDLNPPLPPHISSFSDVLLTPDDFTSPSHSNLQGSFVSIDADSRAASTPKSNSGDLLPVVEATVFQRRKSSQHSGNSSPSREVEEILGPASKVLKHDDFISETIKDDDETTTSNNVSRSPTTSRNEQDFLMKDWPQAPDPTKDFKISHRIDRTLTQSEEQLFDAENGELSVIKSKMSQLNELNVQLSQKFDSLLSVMTNQQRSIQTLENEIVMLRQDQKKTQALSMDSMSKNQFEHIIAQSLIPQFKSLEKLVVQTSEAKHKHSDEDLKLLSEKMSSICTTRVEATLKRELVSNIVPQITRVSDTIQKMQMDQNQKFAATDATIRESLIKHLSKKSFVDSLSQSLSSSIQGALLSASRDTFQNSVVPAFDKCCSHLFQQLNEQFAKGTAEYLHSLDKHGQKASASVDSKVTRIQEEVRGLVSSTQQVIQAQSHKLENYNAEMVKQREVLLNEMRFAVQDETRKALREQTSVVLGSRASTPVQFHDPQVQKQQLLQLIKQGSLDAAFQQALSAMDVQLVLFVCENVKPEDVFGPVPCPLKQHVLLSLVNQLSNDLPTKTELKVRYIEDVITMLDANSPVIKDHIHGVLDSLHQRINLFQQKYPSHALSLKLHRINILANALIKA